jgi:hypothetical protein
MSGGAFCHPANHCFSVNACTAATNINVFKVNAKSLSSHTAIFGKNSRFQAVFWLSKIQLTIPHDSFLTSGRCTLGGAGAPIARKTTNKTTRYARLIFPKGAMAIMDGIRRAGATAAPFPNVESRMVKKYLPSLLRKTKLTERASFPGQGGRMGAAVPIHENRSHAACRVTPSALPMTSQLTLRRLSSSIIA